MPDRYPPIVAGLPHMLHGADYNPDQWPQEMVERDVPLMKLAHTNVMAVGIFAWSQLEPEEGRYTFEWLDHVMDEFASKGMYVLLATPSAAQPAWLSKKYPDILVTGPDRVRRLHSWRNNWCYTSPIYREKTNAMARMLAERYKGHKALGGWHVSNELGNEFGKECHCERCQREFRGWLKRKYGTIERLNDAWWTTFWSHRYSDWDEIESPGAPYGEEVVHGLKLDWKRFCTDEMAAFMANEIAPLKELTPDVAVTTNFMGTFPGFDYWKLAKHLDRISWDCYPQFHGQPDMWRKAVDVAFVHDIMRTMKGGKPFMLMEMSPSSCNWFPVMRLKRAGIHRLQAIQAIAHGSDTVQYFQWRAGRGGLEKFHGAVVAHSDTADTRVFADVAEVGRILEKLDPVVGTTVRPEVAIVYDWENEWAISGADGPRREKRDYFGASASQYRALWAKGIPVDVIDASCDPKPYKLVIAPMLYMVREGLAERIEKYVAGGGTFVTTYWSGIVDENDLAFMGGRPGPLRKLLGVWSEELDVLFDEESVPVVAAARNGAGLKGRYKARIFCDLVHAEGARVLAMYGGEFYKGRPAVTVNKAGKGRAFYIASRNDDAFNADFYGKLVEELGIGGAIDARLPEGVSAQVRTDGERRFVFLLNFKRQAQTVHLGRARYADMITGKKITGSMRLKGYATVILEKRP
jgi:beta-galactosidase